jgi:hypothetical protein
MLYANACSLTLPSPYLNLIELLFIIMYYYSSLNKMQLFNYYLEASKDGKNWDSGRHGL